MKTNPNDYINAQGNQYASSPSGGLTKREEFAKAALQGLLAACAWNTRSEQKEYAKNAVEMADALIAELNREK